MTTSLAAEIQFAVREWYPTWPVAGRAATVAAAGGVDVDAAPVVVTVVVV